MLGPLDCRYILALDNASGTQSLSEVALAVADRLGNTKTEVVPVPDVPLDVTQPATVEERLTINVRLEAAAIKELNVKWRAQSGISEAIDGVVAECVLCS